MHERRRMFVKEIYSYILHVCQEQLSDYKVVEDRALDVLGISDHDLYEILKKIAIALPDYIFLPELYDIYDEVLGYLSREYILFQTQEDITNPDFAINLANFIYEVSNEINQNYNYHDYMEYDIYGQTQGRRNIS